MINMGYNQLMEVRATLGSTSNTTGGDARTTIGGVEINKAIDRMIVDFANRGVDTQDVLLPNVQSLAKSF